MALTDVAVRQARPTGKDYTLRDFDGLSLAVSAKGGKSWHFRYYWAARQKRMSLGTYPEVSLREARALRDEARALLTHAFLIEVVDRIEHDGAREVVREWLTARL